MAVDQDLLDRIASSVADLYREVETAIVRTVAQRLRKDLPSPWQEEKLDAIRQLQASARLILASLQATRARVIRQAIADAYRSGGEAAIADLPQEWFPKSGVGQAARKATAVVPNARLFENIAQALHRDVGRVDQNILRAPVDAYRAVQAGTAARIASGTYTRREASQAAWQRLIDKGLTSFTDRAGRTWRLSTYVEMMGRTNIARAAIQGQTDRLAQLDIDLVYISDNVQECKICRPYESKVLRRDAGPIGKIEVEHATRDDEMVTVDVIDTMAGAMSKGLFHPNCRHSASAYLPGVTKLKTNTADPDGDKARQKQRALERRIRVAKEQVVGALTTEAKKDAGADVRAAQAALRAHLAAHPKLKRLPYREQIGAGNIPKADGPSGGPVGDLRPPVQDELPLDGPERPTPNPAAPTPAPAPEPTPAPASPHHRNLDGLHQLAANVAQVNDQADRGKLSGGQSAATELVTLPDGTQLVAKRGLDWGDPDEVAASVRGQADAEQLSSLLGRTIGAPVVPVYRENDDTVWMPFLPGAVIGTRPDADQLVTGRQGVLLGLLDHLIANADRNSGNIMADGDQLTGIDHGWSWGEHNLTQSGPAIQDGPGRPAHHFSRDGQWVPNPLTTGDVTRLRQRLAELRPDFEHAGRSSWLDYSLRMLSEIARHAAGTVNLLG